MSFDIAAMQLAELALQSANGHPLRFSIQAAALGGARALLCEVTRKVRRQLFAQRRPAFAHQGRFGQRHNTCTPKPLQLQHPTGPLRPATIWEPGRIEMTSVPKLRAAISARAVIPASTINVARANPVLTATGSASSSVRVGWAVTTCIAAQTPDASGSSNYGIVAFPNIMVPMRDGQNGKLTKLYPPKKPL